MSISSQFLRLSVCLVPLLSPFGLHAAETDLAKPTAADATQDATNAMRLFRVAPGLKVDLFAGEPMVQNIVSFTFDEQGRCYVVETHRRRTSVFDITHFPDWLENDFTLRTVEDRADFFRRTLTPTNQAEIDKLTKAKSNFLPDLNGDGIRDWRDLSVESERIRLLVDTNGDGHADIATTLAEGFDDITSGVAAGVLARKGDVWFTCIPDLWKISSAELRRTNAMPDFAPANPHVRNAKFNIQSLIQGFGAHIAVGGHDLHGLKMGPDGKIYFSIADRGTSTNLWDKIVDHWPGLTMEALADSGAVFRCQPDGTELEVVAIGLRNPQELAFDEFGNLFTGDNNSDNGDKSRWEYIVEGADYGWRIGWQWMAKMGAWQSEMLWGMAPSNTSAYYLPPVTYIAAGPAGTAYYPGTGLSARYDNHFFLCDFRGGPNSLVHSFALRPKGASFEAYDETEFIGGFLCTDIEFGLDGAVYVSDWVKGWEKTDQGRIWRVFDPNLVNDAAIAEVKKLLGEGMEKRSNEELVRLLGHRDMRVRLEAQWELANRSVSDHSAYDRLATATEKGDQLSRLHAVWGLGQVIRFAKGTQKGDRLKARAAVAELKLALLASDPDPQIAGYVAKILGETNPAGVWIRELIQARSPRIQLFAVEGLEKAVGHVVPAKRKEFDKAASAALLELLSRNSNQDAYIRHAAVLALARIGDVTALLASAKDSSPAVRMGVCLALRRLQRPEIAQFLNDTDSKIVLEAARAINDVPIPAALPDLAKLVSRISRPEQAQITHRPLRITDAATESFILRRALNAHFRLGQEDNASALASFAANERASDTLRIEALELLSLWARPPGRDRVVGLWRPLPPRDGDVAARALGSVRPKIEADAPNAVKVAAKKASAALSGETTILALTSEDLVKLSRTLEAGTIPEKQSALATLASANDNGAGELLSAWLDKLLAGQVPRELQLDVLEAVRTTSGTTSPATKEKLAKYEAARNSHDSLARWRECLYGGNAQEGRKAFMERQDMACVRCHRINGEGGEVGPELAGIGQRQTREYILESILFPNKTIAAGFESAIVTLKNGRSYAGVIKSETDTRLFINSLEDGPCALDKADIQKRDHALSPMPEGIADILSKQDVRNLIEFLATTPPPGNGLPAKQ